MDNKHRKKMLGHIKTLGKHMLRSVPLSSKNSLPPVTTRFHCCGFKRIRFWCQKHSWIFNLWADVLRECQTGITMALVSGTWPIRPLLIILSEEFVINLQVTADDHAGSCCTSQRCGVTSNRNSFWIQVPEGIRGVKYRFVIEVLSAPLKQLTTTWYSSMEGLDTD